MMPTEYSQDFRVDPADLPSEDIVFGCTAAMQEIRRKMERVRHSDLPVLIRGESGTGKELIARLLHARSARCEAPFVRMNCAALEAGLLESALRGSAPGGLSGAGRPRHGLMELAEGGTLFLDEIGEMDWALQTRLLRWVQEGHPARKGGREQRPARVRILCATRSNLEAAIEARAFRRDLFYRIDVIGLNLPPLRERKEDIPQLCAYFLTKLSRQLGRSAPALDPGALKLMAEWNWPGNMRELENWIARIVILGDDRTLGAELARRIKAAPFDARMGTRAGGDGKTPSRRAAGTTSRSVILKALQANGWSRIKTAEHLNISYRSLLYKLRAAGAPHGCKSPASKGRPLAGLRLEGRGKNGMPGGF